MKNNLTLFFDTCDDDRKIKRMVSFISTGLKEILRTVNLRLEQFAEEFGTEETCKEFGYYFCHGRIKIEDEFVYWNGTDWGYDPPEDYYAKFPVLFLSQSKFESYMQKKRLEEEEKNRYHPDYQI